MCYNCDIVIIQYFSNCEIHCSDESLLTSSLGKPGPKNDSGMMFYLVHGSLQSIADTQFKIM